MDRGRIYLALLLLALAGACAREAQPSIATPSMPSVATATHRPGEPINPGVRPNAVECRQALTADLGAAKRLRAELRIDGIPSTDVAVLAASVDPRSDVTTLGIPLAPDELVALQGSGTYVDRASPLTFWVQAAEPGRFGGIWIDPPGSGRYVVGILDRDATALALARCLDAGLDVRYVAAGSSVADDNALQARIGTDFDELRSSGIRIVSVGVGVRAAVMVVIVGVTGLTDDTRAKLVARYGDTIVIEEQGPITPA